MPTPLRASSLGCSGGSPIANGQVLMFRQTDVMANSSDDRFLAQGLFVLDLSTDTVRVEDFELTCLNP
jgi:hypothetical protein